MFLNFAELLRMAQTTTLESVSADEKACYSPVKFDRKWLIDKLFEVTSASQQYHMNSRHKST
jgi:hypothetical protein